MKTAIYCFLVAGTAACVSRLPHPTETDVRVASAQFDGVTLEELVAGRRAYVVSCAGCHNLYLPKARSPEAWPAIVAEMSARGTVDTTRARQIERYLVTMSTQASSNETSSSARP